MPGEGRTRNSRAMGRVRRVAFRRRVLAMGGLAREVCGAERHGIHRRAFRLGGLATLGIAASLFASLGASGHVAGTGGSGSTQPAWSPDGKTLAYVRYDTTG